MPPAKYSSNAFSGRWSRKSYPSRRFLSLLNMTQNTHNQGFTASRSTTIHQSQPQKSIRAPLDAYASAIFVAQLGHSGQRLVVTLMFQALQRHLPRLFVIHTHLAASRRRELRTSAVHQNTRTRPAPLTVICPPSARRFPSLRATSK